MSCARGRKWTECHIANSRQAMQTKISSSHTGCPFYSVGIKANYRYCHQTTPKPCLKKKTNNRARNKNWSFPDSTRRHQKRQAFHIRLPFALPPPRHTGHPCSSSLAHFFSGSRHRFSFSLSLSLSHGSKYANCVSSLSVICQMMKHTNLSSAPPVACWLTQPFVYCLLPSQLSSLSLDSMVGGLSMNPPHGLTASPCSSLSQTPNGPLKNAQDGSIVEPDPCR